MATRLFIIDDTPTAAEAWSSGNNDTKFNGSADVWTNRPLRTVRGGSPVTRAVATEAGPTNGVEVDHSTASNGTFRWISAPVAADFTLSGTVTCNIWAFESSMNANAAINAAVFKIDGATGAISQVLKTTRTTELGTGDAAANFTGTPTSTAFKRGDRIMVVIFGDDAGTMASGFTFTVTWDGATAGVSGDTWVEFTENITFESTPAGTTIYPTNTASDVATASVDREAWTSRGAGVQTAVRNTAAGWTSPLQFTDTAGGTVIDWFTKPLAAFTLGGAVLVNVRAQESNIAANVAVQCQIAVVDADGTNPTVWGVTTFPDALLTTEAADVFWVASDDLAVTDGQRLRIRFHIDDMNRGAMASGHTATLFYAGTTGGASGDTFLTFSQTLTEFSAPVSGGLTADAVVKKTIAGSFTANAVTKRAQAGSFTADAVIAAVVDVVEGSFTANAVMFKAVSGSFTANAVTKREQTGSFTANAAITRIYLARSASNTNTGTQSGITVSLGFTAVAGRLLVAAISSDKTAGTYTVTGFTQIRAYSNTSVSGGLFYKVSDGTETSVVFSQTNSSPNGISAWVGEIVGVNSPDQSVVSAADETAVNSRSTTTTGATTSALEYAIAIAGIDSASSISSNRAWTNSFTEKSWVAGGVAGNPGLSVTALHLWSTGTVESTFSYTGTADQMFAALVTLTGSDTIEGSFTANAVIKREQAGGFTAGAVVKREATGSFTANATTRREAAGSFTADAVIRATVTGSLTAFAVTKATIVGSFTANAVLLVPGIVHRSSPPIYHWIGFSRETYDQAGPGEDTPDAYPAPDRVQVATESGHAIILAPDPTPVGTTLLTLPNIDHYVAEARVILQPDNGALVGEHPSPFGGFWAYAGVEGDLLFNNQTSDESEFNFGSAGTASLAWTGQPIHIKLARDAALNLGGSLYRYSYAGKVWHEDMAEPDWQRRWTNDVDDASVQPHVGAGAPPGSEVAIDWIVLQAIDQPAAFPTARVLSADAVLGRTQSGTLTADADVRATIAGNVTADAVVSRAQAGSFTADAVLAPSLVTVEGSLTADAVAKREQTGSFTANAVIQKTIIWTAASFPNVIDRATGGNGTQQNFLTVPIPASAQVGHQLLIMYSSRFDGTDTWPSGWVSLLGKPGGGRPHTEEARYKVLTSGDIATGSVTITKDYNAWHSWRSFLFSDAAAFEASGWAASADPPSLSPSWGSDNTFWIALTGAFTTGAGGGNWSGIVVGFPTNYINTVTPQHGESCIGVADRQLIASSEDPSTFTWQDGPFHGVAATIAVHADPVLFTADAVVKKTISGSFTADAVIVRTTAGSLTVDAVIRTTATGLFAADAVVFRTQAGSLTVDAALSRTALGSFTADAAILRSAAGSLTADAVVFRAQAGSFEIQAYIQGLTTGVFSADAVTLRTQVGSFALDAHLISAEQAANFTANAVIEREQTGGVTADAVVLRSQTGSLTADAVVLRIITGSSTVDAVLRREATGSFAADAITQTTSAASFTADAVVTRTQSGTFALDAVLARAGAGTFTLDALLRIERTGGLVADATILRAQPGTLTTDAVLLAERAGTVTIDAFIAGQLTVDAVLHRAQTGSVTLDAFIPGRVIADAVLLRTQTGALTINAFVQGINTYAFAADAIIRREETGSLTTDAIKLAIDQGTLTLDAVLLRAQAGSFTLDALILRLVTGTLTTDAVTRATATGSFTLDARLSQAIAGSVTLDAVLLRAVQGTFTAQAVLFSARSATFSLNAIRRVVATGSWTLDAAIVQTASASITADAVILATRTAGVTADAVILSPRTGSVTLDSYFALAISDAFTIDAVIATPAAVDNFTVRAVIQKAQAGSFTISAVIRVAHHGRTEAQLSARIMAATVSASGVMEATLTTTGLVIEATTFVPRAGTFTIDAVIV